MHPKPSHSSVITCGFPGENSHQLLHRFDHHVLPHRPDAVILLVGANDCLNSSNLIPLQRFTANLGELIDKITAAKAQPYLCTLLPCDARELLQRHTPDAYPQRSPAHAVNQYNTAIGHIATSSHADLIDLHHAFEKHHWPEHNLIRTTANSGVNDGVHPTPAGYRLIAQTIADKLTQNPAPRRTVLCLGDSITYGVHVEGAGTTNGQTYPSYLLKILNGEER